MKSDNVVRTSTPVEMPLPVQSVGRVMELLALLSPAGDRGLALRQLAERTGLKRTTVHSLLRSLQAGRFVEQEPETANYRLGTGLLHLAGQYLQGSNLVRLTEPVMSRLNADTLETVQLAVLRGDRHVNLRTFASTHAVVAAPTAIPEPRLYCTSLGKVLLASAPPEQKKHLLDQIEARGFVAFGPATITNRLALEAELARVAEQGYASNYEEGRPGVIGQAAPVRDFTGATVASLGLAYPALRRTPAYNRRMIEAVCYAAAEASRCLGWQSGHSAQNGRGEQRQQAGRSIKAQRECR